MANSYGRILAVDDDIKLREKIVTYLEDSGFDVYEANNGKEALEVFYKRKPDLVLCDLQMPEMDGLTLLEHIQKESPGTLFIIMSGVEFMSEVISALHLGASDFMVKPISNMAVLEHIVCKALERGRLVAENKKYRIELEKKNAQLTQSLSQLKEDQDAGKSVQQKLFPQPHFKFRDYSFSHKVIPSLYLSGDFVDYFQITENKIGFYIADVSGHGASSAFVTVLLKSLMGRLLTNYQIRQNKVILKPELVLKHINDEILNAKLGKYLTMIYCILDLDDNSLHYSIGGHYPNPVIWDGDTTSYLKGDGFAVGVYENAKFQSYRYDLPSQFSLAMFSDGIFEIMEGRNLQEKENKLLALINKSQLKVEEILTPLGLKNENSGPDDITLLLMNRGAVLEQIYD
ncbi:MAG: fused response regulator/phosphatase [Proteobacteria bacterium]|nr:fused response regulator/phosphatase [Pseudomonadota bacterium]